ncbi:MAG TPA: hypothetical protein VEB64_13245 [Azospirillaceae bacterium]|nr:hypothetical protein [Azospirillaceae bacterium]
MLALLALLALAGPAFADVGIKEFQIVGRTLSMLTTRPTGRIALAVVYAPDVAASRQEAEDVARVLGAGFAVGGLTLAPVLVPVDRLAQGLDGATAVFVTAGLAAQQDTVFQAAGARALPTLTLDFTCVRAGKCVLALKAEPQVEIVLNRRAAEQARVSFASAFRMLVSEM